MRRRVPSRGAANPALVLLLVLLGCSKGVGYVSRTWAELEKSMLAKVAELRAQEASMNAAVKALPALEAGDATGQALKAKLDTAQRVNSSLLAGLDSTLRTGRTAVQEAVRTARVGNSLKAVVDAQTAFDRNLVLLRRSQAAVEADTRRLEAHASEVAAEGRRTSTAGARTDFVDIDFRKDTADLSFESPHTQANLELLLRLVNRCPELVVDLVAHTSGEGDAVASLKLSAQRAQAVKQWLLGKGVGKTKIRSVLGVGGTDPAVPEPPPKAAETMNPSLVEEARRRNRRITAVVATPCPEKKGRPAPAAPGPRPVLQPARATPTGQLTPVPPMPQ
jgi:outer membrane protein OmpA-like peptidoglycan-associated protein